MRLREYKITSLVNTIYRISRPILKKITTLYRKDYVSVTKMTTSNVHLRNLKNIYRYCKTLILSHF